MSLDETRNVVIQKASKVVPILRLRPITKHNGNRRENLNVNAVRVALRKPRSRIVTVGLHVAKKLAVPHHPCTAGLMMLELHEPPIAIPLPKIRPPLRQDVGVNVNLQHDASLNGHHAATFAASAMLFAPKEAVEYRRKIRRASDGSRRNTTEGRLFRAHAAAVR